MNSNLRRILNIFVVAFLLYLLVWPWINSAISKSYHIKAVTDGSPGESYTVDFNPESITASTTYYNNLATEKEAVEESKTYTTKIDEKIYKKLAAAADNYKGFHLVVRHHNGYSFFYESTSVGNMLFTNDDKKQLLDLSRIMTDIARGDEKHPEKRSSTYQKEGLKQLDAFAKEYNISLE